MACGQCSSGGCGVLSTTTKTTPGCGSGGCASAGCNKMNSFDWLANMSYATPKYTVVEVKFKGGRKEYFINKNQIELYTGDFVVCEMPTGYHIGHVSLQGELVRLQLLKKGISDTSELRVIQRLANEKDLEKHSQAINRDLPTMYRTREICKELKLNLKLSEVEFQSDNTKATFYYSADERVDFRELIKMLAGEFKVRIEMRQISLRQEAGRLGGIGSCGRELCCSTWLSDFKAIPTAAARYQNLSLNPAKLSGQCGRLKCCLNYELETYIDAIRGIPSVDRPLQTEKGDAALQKTDIFRRIMWFSYPNDTNWYPIPCVQVVEIQKMNSQGKKPVALEDLSEQGELAAAKPVGINTDLERLDKKYHQKKTKKNKNKSGNKSGNEQSVAGTEPQRKPQETQRKPQEGQRRPQDSTKRPQEPQNKSQESQRKPQEQQNRTQEPQRKPQEQQNKAQEPQRKPQEQQNKAPEALNKPQDNQNAENRNKKRRKYRNNKPKE